MPDIRISIPSNDRREIIKQAFKKGSSFDAEVERMLNASMDKLPEILLGKDEGKKG